MRIKLKGLYASSVPPAERACIGDVLFKTIINLPKADAENRVVLDNINSAGSDN